MKEVIVALLAVFAVIILFHFEDLFSVSSENSWAVHGREHFLGSSNAPLGFHGYRPANMPRCFGPPSPGWCRWIQTPGAKRPRHPCRNGTFRALRICQAHLGWDLHGEISKLWRRFHLWNSWRWCLHNCLCRDTCAQSHETLRNLGMIQLREGKNTSKEAR